MSVIAVRINLDGTIDMAGDTQTSWGGNKFPKPDSSDRGVKASGKVFQVNGMAIGCAGTVAHIGLLQLYAKTHCPKEMERDYILDWFIEFKSWALDKAKIQINEISLHGIIVMNGKAYLFADFLDVWEIVDFGAVGSGMWVAIGAMEAGASAAKAVEVAIKYDLFCGGQATKITI